MRPSIGDTLRRIREQAEQRAAIAGVYGRDREAAAHLQAASNAAARIAALQCEETLPLTCAADVEETPPAWLWGGRLLVGTLAILQGDPCVGKSTLALDLAARVTRGDAFPLDATGAPMGGVLIAGHEDSAPDVRRRLVAAGAVLARVNLMRTAPRLPSQIFALERAIRAGDVRLCIMERATELLGGNGAAVNAALDPLADMAERTGCTVLLLRHLTKGRRGGDLLAGRGSVSGSACARSILTYHSADDRRVLRCATNADGPQAPDLMVTRGDNGRLSYAAVHTHNGGEEAGGTNR